MVKKYAELAMVVLVVMYLAPRTPVVKDLIKAPTA